MTLTEDAGPPPAAAPSHAGARWVRGARVGLLVLLGAALIPAILPFSVETGDSDRVCVPALHGWHADRQKPSEADLQELVDNMTQLPSPEAMRDPLQREKWLAAEESRASTPGYKRAESYVEWIGGPGACIPESRHRLIQTGVGLGGIGIVATAGTFVLHRRKP